MKELIDLLTKKLGVNASQAEGGAAVLFKAAKDKLGGEEFGKLLGGVPGLGGLLGGIAGAMGGNAALITTIVSGFGKLGLTADDAKRFAPVMFEYLRTKVSPDVASKLEKTLRA